MHPCNSVTVGLPVSDIESGVDWYRQLLGNVEELAPVPGVWELQVMPGFWLQLFAASGKHSCATVVRLETEDIENSHALATRLSNEVTAIELVPDTIRYFEFADPFGNQLSFYQLIE